ncbi:MAG: hypothetical protein LBU22_04310 [Dysgonamonadaceae bacterium]|nr:hypothetical protein [Dysgonamonadaceae bacterium]
MTTIAWAEFQVLKGDDLLACALVSPVSERSKGDLKAKLMIEEHLSYERAIRNNAGALLEKCKLGNELWKEVCGGSLVLYVSENDIKK